MIDHQNNGEDKGQVEEEVFQDFDSYDWRKKWSQHKTKNAESQKWRFNENPQIMAMRRVVKKRVYEKQL